ncbi:hypothetical protein [Methylobacterium aerolatum]|uniref:Uncharacterized protein n=1 Tax=Methylobacterium aerolatum TaxID=418708 RepID=A0ABU0I2F4_9HYPH|nr:hypothetical protein [Methylobacterium aerolatum]MDQ0448774.1 hypothetical protein [Methylobacterium aerolatum]GJD34046.1 hypothetical protein FMGBMHLM_0942 [Methylobacterium aerolatum]
MAEGPEHPDDAFEILLRETVTKAVISGLENEHSWNDDIIIRLMDYEARAQQQRLSSQTLQVILSGRRILGRSQENGRPPRSR